jgi:diguanylate cyclase (GGDEF)-like protein
MTDITEILFSIHIQTTVFLIGVSVLIQAGLIWFQSLMIQEYRGIRLAALGTFFYGLGMLLASFRGVFSDTISVVAANYLAVIGTAFIYMAVCAFLNERFNIFIIASAVFPVLVFLPYFTYVRNDLTARVILIGFGISILIGTLAVRLFRLHEVNFRFSARFLAFVSAMYTFVLFLRAVAFLIFPTDDLFSSSPLAALNSIGLFISSFLWSIGFLLMVSHRLQADLNELAMLDSLTRIANRRAMVAHLEAEFARFARTKIDFSVLLVDVDHFKTVNDRYGHETGDQVLHDVAQLMKHALRKQDVISRWGGEEFLILLPGSTPEEAAEIGERLRRLVQHSNISFNGHEVSLTVSIGIGNSASCKDVDHIYKCSDEALYRAKITRNAVAMNYDPV